MDGHQVKRATLGAVYVLFVIGGALAVAFTPPSMAETIGHGWAEVWGWFLLVGGLVCLAGVVTDRWFGEYVGLHLPGAALLVYAGVVFRTVDSEPGRSVGAVLLAGFSLLVFDRWRDVSTLANASHRANRSPEPE